jgi:hypothetical protein
MFPSLRERRSTHAEAARRTAAVLRILADRSSVPLEALRLGLDADSVAAMVHSAYAAVGSVIAERVCTPSTSNACVRTVPLAA